MDRLLWLLLLLLLLCGTLGSFGSYMVRRTLSVGITLTGESPKGNTVN